MKKFYSIIAIAVVFIISFAGKKISGPRAITGNITISGAFAMYPITVKWAEEFKKLNPGVKIDINAGGAGKGMTDVLAGAADIAMCSRDIYPEEVKKGAYGVAVTKDAVVPVMSQKNPALKEIQAKGMKRDAFYNIYITGRYKTWAQAAGIKQNIPLRVYTRSDACGAGETWAKYFVKKQEDLLGVGVYGDPGLAMAVKKDPQGIGYNNIVYIYDSKTKQPTNGVIPIPIDLNNNGKIDAEESFYNNLDEIINAIAAGKYPSPPARDLFFVTKGKPNPVAAAFIKWCLADGQKYVNEAGYISLSKDKLSAEMKKVQ